MKAVEIIITENGYVNILICDAGTAGPQIPRASYEGEKSVAAFARKDGDVPFEDYSKTFEANTVFIWYNAMSFLELLDVGNKKCNVTQKSQVVNTTSIAGFNRVTGPNIMPLSVRTYKEPKDQYRRLRL